MLNRTLTLATIVLALTAVAQADSFLDTFDSIDPAWVTDRYEPDAFVSAPFDGDNRLRIGISTGDSAQNRPSNFSDIFYNTQGRQRAIDTSAPWEVSGDVYISQDMLSGGNLRRTDLWATDSNRANYPILGVVRNDPTDGFNPNAANITTRYRWWDSQTGWVDLATPVTEGWHNLTIQGSNLGFNYLIDGTLVGSDITGSQAGFEDLAMVFVQAYNFGYATYSGQDYSVYWDNISASAIPAPGAFLLVLAGLGSFAWLRKRLG